MATSTEEIQGLIAILEDGMDDNAYMAADRLAEIGGEEIMQKMMALLASTNDNTVYLAARTLSKCTENAKVIEEVFELIKNANEPFLKGVLTEALSGFDCSEYFVEVLKIYLFGTFKASAMAKEVLDGQEFAITPRVIRKAEKHWHHYEHNVKQDDSFMLKKQEIEIMFSMMKELFEE